MLITFLALGKMNLLFMENNLNIFFKDEPLVLKLLLHRYQFQAERLPASRFYHSKIAAAILFYNYSRFSRDCLYEEFADEIIDQLYNKINYDSSIDFGYGLSGLAWGIYYLISEKFICGNLNEVLEEIDACIMERNLHRIRDYSFDTGIRGICFYIRARLEYAKENAMSLPFDESFIGDYQKIERLIGHDAVSTNDVLTMLWNNFKKINCK